MAKECRITFRCNNPILPVQITKRYEQCTLLTAFRYITIIGIWVIEKSFSLSLTLKKGYSLRNGFRSSGSQQDNQDRFRFKTARRARCLFSNISALLGDGVCKSLVFDLIYAVMNGWYFLNPRELNSPILFGLRSFAIFG